MTLCDKCTRSKCKNTDFVGECNRFLSIVEWRDHIHLLSWMDYIKHKLSIGHTNVNFDGRDAIIMPSGREIRITTTVEEIKND